MKSSSFRIFCVLTKNPRRITAECHISKRGSRNGISKHNLGETNDSRFAHALHKGLYFDYMMANPPV